MKINTAKCHEARPQTATEERLRQNKKGMPRMRRQMFLLLFALCAASSFRPALAARTNALPPPEQSAFADIYTLEGVCL